MSSVLGPPTCHISQQQHCQPNRPGGKTFVTPRVRPLHPLRHVPNPVCPTWELSLGNGIASTLHSQEAHGPGGEGPGPGGHWSLRPRQRAEKGPGP